MKRQAGSRMENIFENHATEKGFISRILKELKKLHNKRKFQLRNGNGGKT